ncbi:nuclear transport factor 2 family protein [Halostella pelagica]|uniref:nuclear transport factor 2 family protein n=1 Tax=Halostella pelagica TaxID=2583824 RepID=UPI0013871863|nr:nuclear transport factor 2 family protein [Halostella pelagica]
MPVNTDQTLSEIVHNQLDAYNNTDVEEFGRWFAEDAVISNLSTGADMAQGRSEIRDQYAPLFQEYPTLQCEVLTELTLGKFVFCHERVTGMDEPLEVFAIYLVEGDQIQRLWLTK